MKTFSAKQKLALFISGFLNGFFGAGGGMLMVPILRNNGFDEHKSHALCVSVILPICIISSVFYLAADKVTLNQALPYLPWTLIGSLIGSFLLPKCKAEIIRVIFSALIIFAAGRMIFA